MLTCVASRRRALICAQGRSRGSLAAARSLSESGWEVGIGAPDGASVIGACRHFTHRHTVPRPRGDASAFVSGVAQAVAEGGYDVAFGGGDDWVAALAAYRDRVPAAVAHPASSVVQHSLDKARLATVAGAVGLMPPCTVAADDLDAARWDGPVMVKCRAHWAPGQTQVERIEARWFPDLASARDRLTHIRRAGLQPVLQHAVDGELGALIGLYDEGRLHGRVQQSSSRLWPTPSGVTSRARTVPIDDDLAARVETLLAELGWSGLVELQFLTDHRGDRHLIDFNGRFYGSMALANAARPGLADAWGRRVLGEQVPPLPDGAPGVRFTWLAADLRRAATERRGGLVSDVGATLRWGARAHRSVWDLHGIGPTLALVTERVRPVTRPPAR